MQISCHRNKKAIIEGNNEAADLLVNKLELDLQIPAYN